MPSVLKIVLIAKNVQVVRLPRNYIGETQKTIILKIDLRK